MKIWIITMEDPLYTLDFIKDIIKVKHEQIVGITITKGGRLKVGKKKSKIIYLFSLLIILGPLNFVKNVFKTLLFKVQKKVSSLFSFIKSPGLEFFANSYNIIVDFTDNPNNQDYLNKLRKKKLDVIINQSQSILKKPLIDIPSIGVLNRHNALLPKNRGRLTPFWVLYKKEVETGVSIHLVDEGIDSGDIVVQKRIKVTNDDTFNKLVKKNYEIASDAMIEAIDLIEKGYSDFMYNDDEQATYNTLPTFKQALKYRISFFRR